MIIPHLSIDFGEQKLKLSYSNKDPFNFGGKTNFVLTFSNSL